MWRRALVVIKKVQNLNPHSLCSPRSLCDRKPRNRRRRRRFLKPPQTSADLMYSTFFFARRLFILCTIRLLKLNLNMQSPVKM